MDWLSNVDKEAEHGRKFKQVIEQNGTHFEEGDVKVLEGEEDDVNGNLLEMQQDIETQVDGLVKSIDDNLNQQYQKVKVLLLVYSTFRCTTPYSTYVNSISSCLS